MSALGERLDGPVWLGLGTEPGLSVANKRAELLEKLVGRCALLFELVDPVEPGEYESRLVHAGDRTGGHVACLKRLCD
jgi:hypothetical protein